MMIINLVNSGQLKWDGAVGDGYYMKLCYNKYNSKVCMGTLCTAVVDMKNYHCVDQLMGGSVQQVIFCTLRFIVGNFKGTNFFCQVNLRDI